MRLNNEKLVALIMDAIQVFHEKKDYYSQKEHLVALENSLSDDGKGTSNLMAFLYRNVTVSSWYQEARKCVECINKLNGLYDDCNLDIKRLEHFLCTVDLQAGFSIYNLLKGAKLEDKIPSCLEN